MEEDELDNINICEQSPVYRNCNQQVDRKGQSFSPISLPQSAEPVVPSNNQQMHARKMRRNLNEGQKQILSKNELKKLKGEDENSSSEHDNASNHNEEPEEISHVMTVNRRSRIVRDADALRFSRASSLDQNFIIDADIDSRLQTLSKMRMEHSQSPPRPGQDFESGAHDGHSIE